MNLKYSLNLGPRFQGAHASACSMGMFPAAFLFVFFWSVHLHASVADTLGLGGRAIALGNAYTAVADDFSAVYYNPAGLARVPESKLTIGGIWAHPELYYREEGSEEVCPHIYNTGALFIGVSTNIGHLTGYSQLRHWTFGMSLYMPLERVLLVDVPSESSDKEFIFYLDQTQVMNILVGIAWEPIPKVSIGISGNFLADLRAPNEAFVEVDTSTLLPYLAGIGDLEKEVRPRIMRDAELKVAPIVGVQIQPFPWLEFGVTYRGRIYAETVGSQDILLRFMDSTGQSQLFQTAVLADIHYVHYWTPNQVALGLALRPRSNLLVATDVTWADWSDYIDPLWKTPGRRFRDTYIPRVGIEYGHRTGLAIRAGYSFQASPVPEQTGSSNYLDNDKHVVSIGLGYTFSKSPLPIWKKPITLDSYIQYHQLVRRRYHKQTASGSEGDLTFGGHLINAGINMMLHF